MKWKILFYSIVFLFLVIGQASASLVLRYPMDDVSSSTIQETVNGFNTVPVDNNDQPNSNSIQVHQAGKLGYAINITNTNLTLNITHDISTTILSYLRNANETNVTIHVWVKANNSGQNKVIFDTGTSFPDSFVSSKGMSIYWDSANTIGGYARNNNFGQKTTGYSANIISWYQVVMVWTPSKNDLRLYINGTIS